MHRIMTGLLLALLVVQSHAQVYRHVDEEGNVTFTDQPPQGSEPVEVREPNISAPPPAPARPPEPRPQRNERANVSYQVAITAPANETIIPNGPGNFSVSASVSPRLRDGDLLQLKLGGEPRGEPQEAASWALTNVFRGEQNITVSVVDKKGKELATSEPITVFVFRPSSNNNTPRRRPPTIQPRR